MRAKAGRRAEAGRRTSVDGPRADPELAFHPLELGEELVAHHPRRERILTPLAVGQPNAYDVPTAWVVDVKGLDLQREGRRAAGREGRRG